MIECPRRGVVGRLDGGHTTTAGTLGMLPLPLNVPDVKPPRESTARARRRPARSAPRTPRHAHHQTRPGVEPSTAPTARVGSTKWSRARARARDVELWSSEARSLGCSPVASVRESAVDRKRSARTKRVVRDRARSHSMMASTDARRPSVSAVPRCGRVAYSRAAQTLTPGARSRARSVAPANSPAALVIAP